MVRVLSRRTDDGMLAHSFRTPFATLTAAPTPSRRPQLHMAFDDKATSSDGGAVKLAFVIALLAALLDTTLISTDIGSEHVMRPQKRRGF